MTIFSKKEFISLLNSHLKTYPKMQPQDVVKLCYQQAFGSSHFCGNEKTALTSIRKEMEQCTATPHLPLLEPLDSNGHQFRLSLSAAKAAEISPKILAKAFVLDSKTTPQNSLWFSQALNCLNKLAEHHFFPFDAKQMQAYLLMYQQTGYSAVNHSEEFHNAYEPHYRVFRGQVARLLPLILCIAQKQMQLSDNQRLSVALDGFCASGKTTASALIAEIFCADVVHMDDFFLPPSLRTNSRLQQAGGNIHYERFSQEVAPHLAVCEPFSYQVFDCCQMDFVKTQTIGSSSIILVEGAYALNPACNGKYDISAFFQISAKLQKYRILQRNGAEMWKNFRDLWIPMEHNYAESFQIPSQVDFIIQ